MKHLRVGTAALLGLVLAVAPLAGCSDDDGRADTAGHVTSPPVTLDDTDGPGDGSGDGEPAEPGGPSDGEEPGTTSGLAGSAWLLRSVPDGDGTADTSETPVPAVITFGEDTIDVYDGVNTVAGEYTLDGTDVTIRMGDPSQYPYPDEELPQYGLIALLGGVETARIEDRALVLTVEDGGEITFEQAAGATVSE